MATVDHDAELEMTFDTSETLRLEAPVLNWVPIVILLVFGGVFTVSGIFMMRDQGATLGSVFVLVMGLLIFLLPLLVIYKQRVKGRGSVLILAPGGFGMTASDEKLIPWSEITGAQVTRTRALLLMGIGLTDRGRGFLNRSAVMNRISKTAAAGLGPGDIAITPQQLPMPLEVFYPLFLTYASAHAENAWADAQLAEFMAISDQPEIEPFPRAVASPPRPTM